MGEQDTSAATGAPVPPRRTKAQWARDRAEQLRAQVQLLRNTSTGGNYRKVAAKGCGIDNLYREITRFEGLAARYDLTGE